MRLEEIIAELFDKHSASNVFEAMGEYAEKQRDGVFDPQHSNFWHRTSEDMYRIQRRAEKEMR